MTNYNIGYINTNGKTTKTWKQKQEENNCMDISSDKLTI